MPRPSPELPDVVLIVFDTARRDRFGCYGYEQPTTPTVDALAGEGVRLDEVVAQGPWTLPSHGSLFTGLYPTEHGSQWQTGPKLRPSVEVTMAEWLRSLGYTTVCGTNNGLISERTGLARGFERYAFRLDLERGWPRVARRVQKVVTGGDSGGRIVNRWVDRTLADVEGPLFLFVNYLECHWAYAPPPRLLRRMRDGERHGLVEGMRYRAATAARVGPWQAVATSDERRLRVLSRLYDGELANADEHLRSLLASLRRHGRLGSRPAIVMVTSDHGEHIGEPAGPGGRPLADHHASLDDTLTLVPFVVWGPQAGVPAGRKVEGTYELVDVLPSLAAHLGVEAPAAYLAGRRQGMLAGEGGGGPAFLEWRAWTEKEQTRLRARNPAYDFDGLARDLVGVRDGRFKLVREAGAEGREVLHDLEADPHELRDASAEHPGVADDLRKRLDAEIARWNGLEGDVAGYTDEERREIEERLTELGYI